LKSIKPTISTISDQSLDAFTRVIDFIKSLYPAQGTIPLHEPRFTGNERRYVLDAIDSTFVSSVGAYVGRFEEMMQEITGAKYAIALVNGTSALHIALKLAGVRQGDLVITQPMTFVATCNAISYLGAEPLFVDIDKTHLGMAPDALEELIREAVVVRDGAAYHKPSGRRISACLPMHTFGFPVAIDHIVALCASCHIPVVEDAAESLGSFYKDRHTGTFGLLGTFSFNGNKTVTCGGGGIIVTNDEALGKRAKHITTTAKMPHPWEFWHDEVGYNYRCPNLNAALACAQLEQLEGFVQNKRATAARYAAFFEDTAFTLVQEQPDSFANYWLNTLLLPGPAERDAFLEMTNRAGVMTRPVWTLMHQLPMFEKCPRMPLPNSEDIAARAVNIPSSVRI
jgi:perosamine synthetase